MQRERFLPSLSDSGTKLLSYTHQPHCCQPFLCRRKILVVAEASYAYIIDRRQLLAYCESVTLYTEPVMMFPPRRRPELSLKFPTTHHIYTHHDTSPPCQKVPKRKCRIPIIFQWVPIGAHGEHLFDLMTGRRAPYGIHDWSCYDTTDRKNNASSTWDMGDSRLILAR